MDNTHIESESVLQQLQNSVINQNEVPDPDQVTIEVMPLDEGSFPIVAENEKVEIVMQAVSNEQNSSAVTENEGPIAIESDVVGVASPKCVENVLGTCAEDEAIEVVDYHEKTTLYIPDIETPNGEKPSMLGDYLCFNSFDHFNEFFNAYKIATMTSFCTMCNTRNFSKKSEFTLRIIT